MATAVPRTTGSPQVVAHRGASSEHAEHTLAAYVRALDVGADALECDVRLTADQHLVCVHDRTTRRTGSDAGRPHRGVVSAMELDDLHKLDFASWKNPWADLDDETPTVDDELNRVLTMRRLLEVVRDYDRRVEIAIETKHPTRYAGAVERGLVKLLAEFGWTGKDSPVRVMSFSVTALQRVERLAPDLRLVMLMERKRHWPALKPVLGDDWILGPGVHLLRESPAFAERLARTGRELHVWTVNTAEELQVCRDLGVSAVITDRPAYMLKKLDR